MEEQAKRDWLKALAIFLVAGGLFCATNFVPEDSPRWGLIRFAIDIAPFALVPFAFRFWIFRDRAKVSAQRWMVLGILVMVLFAAAFLPPRFFEHYAPFLRGLEGRYLALTASLVLLIVILFTVLAIVRRYRHKRS